MRYMDNRPYVLRVNLSEIQAIADALKGKKAKVALDLRERITNLISRRTRADGETHYSMAMKYIQECGERGVTSADITGALGISGQSACSLLNNLWQMGFVEKQGQRRNDCSGTLANVYVETSFVGSNNCEKTTDQVDTGNGRKTSKKDAGESQAVACGSRQIYNRHAGGALAINSSRNRNRQKGLRN
jgi:hypothetical protein